MWEGTQPTFTTSVTWLIVGSRVASNLLNSESAYDIEALHLGAHGSWLFADTNFPSAEQVIRTLVEEPPMSPLAISCSHRAGGVKASRCIDLTPGV